MGNAHILPSRFGSTVAAIYSVAAAEQLERVPGIHALLSRLIPGAVVEEVHAMGADDTSTGDATTKEVGYGVPFRIAVRERSGRRRQFVFHTATPDDFGHDRRSDRAGNMLLAYDTFGSIPKHVAPLDVGAINPDGSLQSVRDSGEFYLLTEYAHGRLYADDLRRLAEGKAVGASDRARCDQLAGYLASLHSSKLDGATLYRRSIRDLVGKGEGIFGMIDGYPAEVPAAPGGRLRAIEQRCVDWRWRLRHSENRLARIHGDFHPFNILFDEKDDLTPLDAARGCLGDPADDVACLSINYVFFALDHERAWLGGLRELWYRFWDKYMAATSDEELLNIAPPFFAWRALVLANPRWYPRLSAPARDALLGAAERALDHRRLDPSSVEKVFK